MHELEILISIVSVGLVSAAWAYNKGVEHTEERWSNAVHKEEWAKRYGP